MKVKKTKLPEDSAAAKYLPMDFTEVLGVTITDSTALNPDDLLVGFWTDMPAWVIFLFKLRNLLVRPFGLNNEARDISKFAAAIRNGASDSLMSVTDKTDKETVLYLNDKHLGAYLSVYVEQLERDNQQRIVVTTLVKFHKRFGKLYFFVIYPFHCIIVKQQVKRIVKKLLKKEYIS
jgi:hypothetical protein